MPDSHRAPKADPPRAKVIRAAAGAIRTSALELARKAERLHETPEGEQLFRHIDMLLAGADAMDADAEELEHGPRGARGKRAIRYIVYAPPVPGEPYLAVALLGGRPILTSGAPDLQGAERIVTRMQARLRPGDVVRWGHGPDATPALLRRGGRPSE